MPSQRRTSGTRRPAVQKKKKPPAKARASGRGSNHAHRLLAEVWDSSICWGTVGLRAVVSVALLLLAAITTWTFAEQIAVAKDGGGWSFAPLHFFGLGVVLMVITRRGLPDGLLYLYVLGHELTHVVFVYLCGGRVHEDIRVSARGGHVVANKSNWLITLSPYFVPFYTVLAASGFVVASPLVDLSRVFSIGWVEFQLLYGLYALIGFTWSMHIVYTLTMFHRDQPDLRMNGLGLSLLVIYMVNLLIVIGFVTWVSSSITWRGFVETWCRVSQEWINLMLIRLAALIW